MYYMLMLESLIILWKAHVGFSRSTLIFMRYCQCAIHVGVLQIYLTKILITKLCDK